MKKNYIVSESQLQKIIENIEPSKTTIKNICDSEKFCKSQGKITFGQLKAIVDNATRKRIFKQVGEGGVKATIRVLPWFVPQLFIPGAIAGAVRAANKLLAPSLVQTNSYKTFWGKLILNSFKIAEGDINLSDPLSKILFISDGLLTMLDDKYKVKFAKYISNIASEKPDNEEVPEYFVENELRNWVNNKFLLNPPIPPKVSDTEIDKIDGWDETSNTDEIKEQEEEEKTTDTTFDFYKSQYNPDDKSMVGAYTIYDETDKMVELLNIQELKSDKGLYMDGSEPYYIKINKVKLPKSQIEILGPVEGKDNFVYIKIPYWLFKKQINELSVKRISGLKKINFTPYQYKDNNFLSMLNDPKIIDNLITSNPDSTTKSWVSSVGRRYNPEE